MERNRIFIGIDDTDNAESKGTGFFSRELGHSIEKKGLGKVLGISRHQLLKSSDIIYTTRNSASCIELMICIDIKEIVSFIKDFIKKNATPESHTGFCIIDSQRVTKNLILFGKKAQKSKISISDATSIAKEDCIYVGGKSETANGIIGALAAIGLRASGNDGIMIWAKGKEIMPMKGVFNAGEVYSSTHIDILKSVDGFKIPVNARIEICETDNPTIKENSVTLFVEEHPEKEVCDWRVVSSFN